MEEKANTGGFMVFVNDLRKEKPLTKEEEELIERLNNKIKMYNKQMALEESLKPKPKKKSYFKKKFILIYDRVYKFFKILFD